MTKIPTADEVLAEFYCLQRQWTEKYGGSYKESVIGNIQPGYDLFLGYPTQINGVYAPMDLEYMGCGYYYKDDNLCPFIKSEYWVWSIEYVKAEAVDWPLDKLAWKMFVYDFKEYGRRDRLIIPPEVLIPRIEWRIMMSVMGPAHA